MIWWSRIQTQLFPQMKIGPKTLLLIDLILDAGIDLLEFSQCPTKSLYGGGSWSSDSQLRRDLNRLHEKGLLERTVDEERSRWVLKVTELGKSEVTHDIDPEVHWKRIWDGKWRVVVFDLPTHARRQRLDLHLWLKKRRFGGLQGSTWITPIFPDKWNSEIKTLKVNSSDISFLEGKSFGQNTDSDFVNEAWDFRKINKLYKGLIDFYQNNNDPSKPKWLQMESQLWRPAFEADPFLPESLLPKDYLGKTAVSLRRSILKKSFSQPETT